MINAAKLAAERQFQTRVKKITPLGGGFYGRVFLAVLEKEPYHAVIKLYLFPNIAQKEALGLKTLTKYANVLMPEIYFSSRADALCPYDALGMQYIPGVNAGELLNLPGNAWETVADEIIDNLISYHSALNPQGFGELDAQHFEKDWRDVYYPASLETCEKAKALYKEGKLPPGVLETVSRALECFGRIFYLPVTEARLIHGDYNTWNILLTEDLRHVKAVIDPYGCRWADAEFDLYQLDNANGCYFGLLERYRAKRRLSENFALKRAFYELFTELKHYCDAKVAIEKSNIPQQAVLLRDRMREFGIE